MLTDPDEQSIANGHNIKKESVQERTATAGGCAGIDEEEESFLRFELPLVITGWVVFLIIFGYFMYG